MACDSGSNKPSSSHSPHSSVQRDMGPLRKQRHLNRTRARMERSSFTRTERTSLRTPAAHLQNPRVGGLGHIAFGLISADDWKCLVALEILHVGTKIIILNQ